MPAQAKPRLFINYRREDSEAQASRLADALERALAPGQVFRDREGLHAGDGWRERLHAEVDRCSIMFCLMGRSWERVSDAATGAPRLSAPEDWVRTEIERGLARQSCAIVPVLVDRDDVPAEDTLPESIRAMIGRQAIRLRTRDWNHDVAMIVTLLTADRSDASGPGFAFKPRSYRARIALVTTLAALSVAGVARIASRPVAPPLPHVVRTTANGSATGVALERAAIVQLAVETSSQAGIERVEYLVDDRLVGSAVTAPWTFDWRVADPVWVGEHQVMARVVGLDEVRGEPSRPVAVAVTLPPRGVPRWTREVELIPRPESGLQVAGIAVGRRGRLVVAGTAEIRNQALSLSSVDQWVYCCTSEGELDWRSTWNGPGEKEDRCADLAIDRDGNIILVGTTQHDEETRLVIRKLAPSGEVVLEGRAHSPRGGVFTPHCCALDSDGNLIIGGDHGQAWIGKYRGSDGEEIWSLDLGDTGPVRDVDCDGQGRIIAVGGSQNVELWVIDRDKTVLWRDSVKGRLWRTYATGVAVDRADGSFVVTGGASSNDAKTDEDMRYDVWTRRYDAQRGVVWTETATWNEHFRSFGAAVRLGPDGEVCVLAEAEVSFNNRLCWLLAYGRDGGARAWDFLYQGDPAETSAFDAPAGIALDEVGNVYFAGRVEDRVLIGMLPP